MPVGMREIDNPIVYFRFQADVTAGRGMLNGSGIYFDQDTYYAHWYKNFFNKTIPLFGPYAWRADDFYGRLTLLFLCSMSIHNSIHFRSIQLETSMDESYHSRRRYWSWSESPVHVPIQSSE